MSTIESSQLCNPIPCRWNLEKLSDSDQLIRAGYDGQGVRLQKVLLTLDDQIRPENAHCRNADASFGGPVCCTETCEDDGTRTTHDAEERLCLPVSKLDLPGPDIGCSLFSKIERSNADRNLRNEVL